MCVVSLCGTGYEFSVYIMQRGKQYEERDVIEEGPYGLSVV